MVAWGKKINLEMFRKGINRTNVLLDWKKNKKTMMTASFPVWEIPKRIIERGKGGLERRLSS